ncbi:hypothetical protein HPB50_020034 [Hyalomma asiaticum]|uniref:Uncharacterized protein n=1 Tax=Hyalomma asiaticum TaxID=266040 RepID=A0ACB7SGL3_HYAAI|nr:hypothetical protein HPB50_020034 [Hyalomma asiaticum]
MMSTLNDYYTKPFYHGVCYFSGCMTSLIVADFRVLSISKALRLAGWCVCISCGLFCVFVKLPWYTVEYPTSATIEMVLAFFDRILWSISVAWITLTCSTGRGGLVNNFLSWNAFVPLSKLSYGVYVIHWPLLTLMMLSSRERVDSSNFNRVTLFFGVLVWCFLLSYLLFITCEAPVAALDKLAFGMLIKGDSSRRQERQEKLEGSGKEQRNGQRRSPTPTKNGALGLGELSIRRGNCKKTK